MSSRFMNILFHHLSICLFTELSPQCSLDLFFTSVVYLIGVIQWIQVFSFAGVNTNRRATSVFVKVLAVN